MQQLGRVAARLCRAFPSEPQTQLTRFLFPSSVAASQNLLHSTLSSYHPWVNSQSPATSASKHLSPRFSASFSLAAAQEVQQEYDVFTIKVVTGNIRGAGTTAAVFVQLVGAHGISPPYHIGDEDFEFTRGSVKSFHVPVPRDIGPLRRLHVQRAEVSQCTLGDGWFLEQVEVESPDGQFYLFPCHSWLGQSDCGDFNGSLERNLLPCAVVAQPEEDVASQPVEVAASGIAIPHPDKIARDHIKGVNKKSFGYGGEDAYFYCHGKNGIFGMGVADGVYMWKEKGIDSGVFSRTLMETALHMIQAGCEDVYRVMQTAARHVESEGVYGSSTCSLMTINMPRGRLQAANLGDSGFLVVGYEPTHEDDPNLRLRIKFRTTQLEHDFGCPYQLGHQKTANKPEDAELASFPVIKGDVIVMGSDGLLDNVSDAEVLAAVEKVKAEHGKPPQLAQLLAKMAFETSLDRKKSTPYSKAATEAFDMVYTGGKPDDITVLVAFLE